MSAAGTMAEAATGLVRGTANGVNRGGSAGSAAPVVTGLGVIAPTGLGVEEYWRATLRGDRGIGPVTRFDAEGYPVSLAGEVRGFDPAAQLGSRLMPQTDPVTRLSLAAADWALADAGLDTGSGSGARAAASAASSSGAASVARGAASAAGGSASVADPFTVGAVTASTSGGFEFGQRELANLWARGGSHVSAYQSFAWFYAVNSGQISIRHGLRGPSGVLVTDQAGGLDAVGKARRDLRRGSRAVLTGAVDTSLCPWSWAAYLACGELSPEPDPLRAYVPFDQAASGWLPGEGGAILVLEDAAAARERGAHVYGRIAGYASGFDPAPGSSRPPALSRVIGEALLDAGLAPGDVDVVFADAHGTLERDFAEAAALSAVFGPGGVPVTAPKTATGRLSAGSGALDVATALLALRDGVIPPTVNTARLAPGVEIDLVTGAPRPARLRSALVLARGRGGFNAAVVVTAPDHDAA
jgi:act minimal PKS chain-length factor (CLF/KS beta)